MSKSSQVLVFSKTSFQRERISPQSPRAVFFNDEVYVGYVVGSPLLELATVDPKLGWVFYTLEQAEVEKPKFVRTDQCLECHASAKTMGVPGHLVRSFATDDDGVVDLATGTSLVNHRTPLEERWGGWYVTGTHGNQLHSAFGKALIYGGTTADVILNGFPLCHVASAFVFGLSTLLAGGCVALPAAHSQRVTTPASLLALTPFSSYVTLGSLSFCRPEMTALRTPSASRLAWQVSSKSQL